jgi:hypothetical protein
MEKIETELEFPDDIDFEKRLSRIKTIFLVVMLLIMLAALGGLLGYSGWTKVRVGNTQDVTVEYERFLRITRETPMKFIVNTAGADSIIELRLSNSYFEKVNLKTITPEPASTSLGNGYYTLRFNITPGHAHETFTLNTIAHKSGKAILAITTGTKTYVVSQFIYP